MHGHACELWHMNCNHGSEIGTGSFMREATAECVDKEIKSSDREQYLFDSGSSVVWTCRNYEVHDLSFSLILSLLCFEDLGSSLWNHLLVSDV